LENHITRPTGRREPRVPNVAIPFPCAARYYLSGWVHDLAGIGFPYGTLAVNVAGSFLVGLVMETGSRTTLLSPDLRIGLVIGLLGGLATFSSFSYETFKQIEGGDFVPAAANIAVTVLLCLYFHLAWDNHRKTAVG